MNSQQLQILRSIDKCDKIGINGVIELLQRPEEEFGANLNPVLANLIGMFLNTKGVNNAGTLDNIKAFFKRATLVSNRIRLMVIFEETVIDDNGRTLWEQLIEMPTNRNETWSNNGRPANIGWALDDIVEVLEKTLKEHNGS